MQIVLCVPLLHVVNGGREVPDGNLAEGDGVRGNIPGTAVISVEMVNSLLRSLITDLRSQIQHFTHVT